jgi:hypothetical protein
LRIEAEGLRAGKGCRIGEGSSGGAVAVRAVAAGRETDDGLAVEPLSEEQSASEGKLLVSAARSCLAIEMDGDLATGEQTYLAICIPAQLHETVDEILGSLVIRPVIAGVVDDDVVSESAGLLARGAHEIAVGE